jgi:hypothetical protein
MKLRPRTGSEPPKELRFRLDGETHRELELYGELYAEEYGEPIETPALAAEILRQFLAADRAFRGWKRRRADSGNGAQPRDEEARA